MPRCSGPPTQPHGGPALLACVGGFGRQEQTRRPANDEPRPLLAVAAAAGPCKARASDQENC